MPTAEQHDHSDQSSTVEQQDRSPAIEELWPVVNLRAILSVEQQHDNLSDVVLHDDSPNVNALFDLQPEVIYRPMPKLQIQVHAISVKTRSSFV